jgi:hypothetical protein
MSLPSAPARSTTLVTLQRSIRDHQDPVGACAACDRKPPPQLQQTMTNAVLVAPTSDALHKIQAMIRILPGIL